MRITFIRHAQSLHNATGDIIVNCGLSDAGVEQAKKIDISFDCVVLSPLRRTLQTYALSQIKTKVVLLSALFREHHPLGHPSNFLENEDMKMEQPQQFQKRVGQAMEFLKNLPYQNVCVITHHDFTAEFSKLVYHKPVYIRNAGFITFDI